MQVLWLASWYPNPYEPFNGDFIQRHANALASLLPVNVVHVVQLGSHKATKAGVIHNKTDNLRELIYSFNYTPTGIKWLDKIRYNIKYQFFYSQLLEKYKSQFGKPDIIHIHVPMKAGIIGRKKAILWERNYVVSEQASHYEMTAHDNYSTRSYFFKRNTSKVIKQAAAITNVSATIGKTIQSLFNTKEVITIHNCVDTSLFYYTPIEQNTFRFIHVSALNSQKNIEGILAALAILYKKNTNWELVIVGPAVDSLKQFLQAQPFAKNIIFKGEIPYSSVAEEIQLANCFVLFSKHENFPCAVIEALCCGLTVIASNVGGVAEAVNETNGLLVQNNNVEDLALALENMLNDYNKYDRKNIATAATRVYNYNTIGQQFLNFYGKNK